MLTIAYSTKSENDGYREHIIKTCGIPNIEILVYENSGDKNLTDIYNDVLDKAKFDKIIFMHDDLQFLTNEWGNIVLKLFNENVEYGIIGIAGSAYYDNNGAWWKYENIYGQVYHTNGEKVWRTDFSKSLNNKLKEVVVIDGLFMAVDRTKIKKKFNPIITGFHFYDIDFCLNNYLTDEIKIGVTTLIPVLHKSIGKLNEKWIINREKINGIYGEYYPIK